jgi:acyl carrier protein
MTENEILQAVEELLELSSGTLKPSDHLHNLNWDSLAVLGFISMIDQRLEIQLRPAAMGRCVTVHDLYTLVTACAA